MTSNPTTAYKALARTLEYPTKDYVGHVEACRTLLRADYPTVAAHVDAFAVATESLSLAAREEQFIQMFDFNPKCTLDIGWQLFAEDYNRGLFLAKLRAESRRLGVPETHELPDHLPHVLRLLGRMEEAAAADFAATCVVRAVEKLLGAMAETNPYRHIIQGVLTLLGVVYSPQAVVELT